MATANISVSVGVQDTATVGVGSYSGNPNVNKAVTLSSTDITKVWSASRTITTADTFDVTSGLTSAYGTALVFATVKTVAILNTHATASLVLGGGSNPLFGTDLYTIKAGQILYVAAVPVTVDGTHKVLTITPSASCTYQVIVLGS